MDFANLLSNPQSVIFDGVSKLAEKVAAYVPALIGAIIILIAGWAIGSFVEYATRRVLRKLGLHRMVRQSGLEERAKMIGVDLSFMEIASKLLKYLVYLVALMLIFEQLGISRMSTLTENVLAYTPNVVAALLVLVIGSMIAEILEDLIRLFTHSTGLDNLFAECGAEFLPSTIISMGTKYFVYLTILTMALTQLGFQTVLLTMIVGGAAVITVFFVFLTLFFSVKSSLPNVFAGVFIRNSKMLREGDAVEVEGVKGIVSKVGLMNVVVDDGKAKIPVPNSKVIEGNCRIVKSK
ncbi:MAG: mechanosensitive ion channel domain-containing protein [Candidatus Micrarchaeota archaeon]